MPTYDITVSFILPGEIDRGGFRLSVVECGMKLEVVMTMPALLTGSKKDKND